MGWARGSANKGRPVPFGVFRGGASASVSRGIHRATSHRGWKQVQQVRDA